MTGVDIGPLEPGQGLEHATGQVGIDEEGHPRRQQRVPAEDGHEPGGTGGDDDPFGVVGIEDAQCTEVFGAAGHDLLQHRVVGLHLRDLAAPLGQSFGGGGPLEGLTAEVLGGEHCSVDDRADLDTGRPLPPGWHDDLEGEQPGGHRCGADRTQLDAPGDGSPGVGVGQGGRRLLPVAHGPGRSLGDLGGGGAGRGAALHPALLHREEIGEVGVDQHFDRARRSFVGKVAEGELLAHALSHMPAPEHHQRRIGPPRGGMVACDEGGAEGVVGHRGQGLRLGSVDHDLEPGDDPGVPEEEALGGTGHDVSGAGTDGTAGVLTAGIPPVRQGRRINYDG